MNLFRIVVIQLFCKYSLVTFALVSVTVSYAEPEKKPEKHNKTIEKISVTALKRSTDTDKTPINIAVLDDDFIEQFHLSELSDIARWIPNLTVTDQGNRYSAPIIVRGLNTNTSGPASNGNTVATYLGETPLSIDLTLIDINRVETLIGPQGTLYGAGTLAGAIRYIPNKPDLDVTSTKITANLSTTSHSEDVGNALSIIVNQPLVENKLGFRLAASKEKEAGFINYNAVIKQPGVSITDPDWSNITEVNNNTIRYKDANDKNYTTLKAMLRWLPNAKNDITLSYYQQDEKINGRSFTHYQSLNENNPLFTSTGKYDAVYRYLEPVKRKTSLWNVNIVSQLPFAELTTATSFSQLESNGSRDQSDFYIQLGWDYEEFPAFSAFAQDKEKEENATQELRLVSTNTSPISWVIGGFYNRFTFSQQTQEITPGYSNFRLTNPQWIDVSGAGDFELLVADQARPDDIDYIADARMKTTDKAIFGELGFQATNKLTFTLGARFFTYENELGAASDFPSFDTQFFGRPANDIYLDITTEKTKDQGNLFKFTADYQFNDNIYSYFTISEGFRLGGSNGIPRCNASNEQFVCASNDEFSFEPDTTENYELGIKSNWLENHLTFNATLFTIHWRDAQLNSTSAIGGVPITVNAGSAKSTGVELSSRAIWSPHFSTFANYSYTDAFLSKQPEKLALATANKQDRLPGSAREQFTLGMTYNTDVLTNKQLNLHYGLSYQGNVYTSVGLINDGEILPGYHLHALSASLIDNQWQLTLYANNLFNEYAYTSVRQNRGVANQSNRSDISRYYGHYLVKPQKIGLRFTYLFN